jgi:hypothetical protein
LQLKTKLTPKLHPVYLSSDGFARVSGQKIDKSKKFFTGQKIEPPPLG